MTSQNVASLEQAAQLLDRLESEWRPRLPSISLLTEIEVDLATLRAVSQALGLRYKAKISKGAYRSLFDRWPACVAVTLTNVAVHDYRQGTLWPYIWDALGYRKHAGQQDVTAWGEAYLSALRTFRLPLFSEREQKYLGPMLMHAGIPTYCLEDFFNLLLRRRGHDPSIDADALLAWATARKTRLNPLDMPARRFISYGTDYAVDVIDRCLDLLDRLGSPEPDLDGLGLPARYIERAQELHRQGRLELKHSASAPRRSAKAERPRLGLDPFGQCVQIILPPVGDTPDGMARWNVTVDGVPNIVRSRSMWVGAAEGAPKTTFPLSKPARSAQVSLYGTPHETEIEIVDADDPLLIFTEGGRRIPAHLAVPPDTVWLLHPCDRTVVADVPPRTIVECPLPVGWDGWRLSQVVLEGATWVGLSGEGSRRRPIRGHSRPRVISGEPVSGITTPYGSPVYSTPPSVWLPAETRTSWLVDIRPAAGGGSVFTRSFTVEEPTKIGAELWAGLPRPVLGAFEVTVRGPIGRSTRRTVFIAEDLRTAYTPSVRLFSPAGLVPGEASITAGRTMTVEPPVLSYSPTEREQVVTCTAGDQIESLIVAPPYMRVLAEETGQSPRWHTGPVRLLTETFSDAESLLVEVPASGALPPIEVLAGGRCVQEISPSGRGRYSLKRAQDTVARHRSADLVLSLTGRRVPVARVRPAVLASGVAPEGDALVLQECVWVEGLTAEVYLCTAPWREPEIISVERDGRIPLPLDMVDAGRMHVRLTVEDPWMSAERPRWPHPRETLICEAPGRFGGADAEERRLSGYLAGLNELPPKATRLDRLWTIIDLANRIDYPSAARRIEECAALLRRHDDAVRSLPDAGLPPDRTVVALITTGLAAMPPDGFRESDIGMWRKAPVVAALLTSSALPGIAEDSDLLAEIEAECGASAVAILRGHGDPHPEAGVFDAGAELMARQPPERLEELWRAAQVVPAALLDRDTRVTAARLLFDQRNCRDGRKLAEHAERVVREARALRLTQFGDLERYIRARCHPRRTGGWVTLPAMSIAFALVARIAARGHGGCQHLERQFRPLWRMLAKIAPDLTALDLIRAELIVAAHRPV